MCDGRENVNLKEDGIYGPRTAAAVKQYKYKDLPARRILQRLACTAWMP